MAVSIVQSQTHMEEPLCFDRHLRHAFTPITVRLQHGLKALDAVIEMLRLRIEAEAQFAAALQRILSNDHLSFHLPPSESLRKDGMDAIHADMKNEYTQRLEYVNSLTEDVYQPCLAMRDVYASKNRTFALDTKENIKQLRQHQSVFHKTKAKYEKVCKDASTARTSLLRAKSDAKMTSPQILKLGNKVNSTLKTQQSWKERYEQQALEWHREQIRFDDQMTAMLQGMQSNEASRMAMIQDSLNKWAVFTTNLGANRNYDCKSLAESMALMNPVLDLQTFMRQTLARYPPQTPNGQIPPHHALYYGKDQKDALAHLNKTSSEKPGKHVGRASVSATASEQHQMMSMEKGLSAPGPSSPHSMSHSKSLRSSSVQANGHGNGNGNGTLGRQTSFSFSSYNPSFPNRTQSFAEGTTTATTGATGALSLGNVHNGANYGTQRRPSRSYSTSEQHSTQPYDLSKRSNRQNATPNSIGGFFKQKFQKQQSFTNSQNHLSMQEHSHTLSSYNGSGVYPPVDDGDAASPKARSRHDTEHNPEIPPMDKNTSADSANAVISATRQRSLSKKKKLSKPQRRYSQQQSKNSSSPRKKQKQLLQQQPPQNQNMSSFPESPDPNSRSSHTGPQTPDLQSMINQNQSPQTTPLTPLTPPTKETQPEPMTLSKSHSPKSPKITMNFGPRNQNQLQQKPQMVIIKRNRSKSPSPTPPTANGNTQNTHTQHHNSNKHNHNNVTTTTTTTAEEVAVANRRRRFTEEEREQSTPELSPTTTPIMAPASNVIGNTQMSQIQPLSIAPASIAANKQGGDTPVPEAKKKISNQMGAASHISESDDEEVDPLD